jgi:hypothetical protein
MLIPAFCPCCIGNNKLPASRRLQPYTRDRDLWDHLETHLEEFSWPGECPHHLCSLPLKDETSFLYHMSNVHSLRTSPHIQ